MYFASRQFLFSPLNKDLQSITNTLFYLNFKYLSYRISKNPPFPLKYPLEFTKYFLFLSIDIKLLT